MGQTKSNLYNTESNILADVAKIISHPARISILNYISNQKNGCICNDLVKEIGLAQPTISQHLSEIKSMDLIHQKAAGKKIIYTINKEKLNEYRRALNNYFVKLQIQST